MGIFGKLFGGNTKNENKSSNNEIADFFKIDLKNLPDGTFSELKTDGDFTDEVKTYRKQLQYKECGIFDVVEVRVVGKDSINVSFLNYNPDEINMGKMKELINGIYKLYGNDDNKKGKFNNQDISEYKDDEFNMLFGRRWNDFPKYKNAVAVQRDEDQVELAIWNANK